MAQLQTTAAGSCACSDDAHGCGCHLLQKAQLLLTATTTAQAATVRVPRGATPGGNGRWWERPAAIHRPVMIEAMVRIRILVSRAGG